MDVPVFTQDMFIVFCLMGITVLLFLTEWVRVDVTALFVMLSLPVCGIIDGNQTFRGLSSNAVISIMAVLIMGRGLDHAGVVSKMVRPMLPLAGKSKNRIIILLSIVVAVISSFMQNVGAAALFLPAIRRLSQKTHISISQLLMPVGFAAILGGTVTLVGSSPLIMLNDLIAPYHLEPFGLFSVTPVGLTLVGCGILYFVVAGGFILPKKKSENKNTAATDNPISHYPGLGQLHEVAVPLSFKKSLRITDLGEQYTLHVVGMAFNENDILLPPDRAMYIPVGSTLALYGSKDSIDRFTADHGLAPKPALEIFQEAMADDTAGVAEALITPHSTFIGKTLGEVRFRHNHLMAPLAYTHEEKTFLHNFWDKKLHAGDAILMHGSWESFHALRPKRDVVFAQSIDHEILRPEKTAIALCCFGIATALVLFSGLPLAVSLMTGALCMVLTRVINIDEAYRSIDWRTVFLLGGLIPLGIALEKTGAAAWLAFHIMSIMGRPLPFVFLFIVGAITTVFTLVVSNVGAVVLLIPLVLPMATEVGTDPRITAMVVALAASNSFLLPTHQVNALYMGPGKYKSRDFIKAGAPLSLLFLVVLTAVVSFFYT